MVLAQTTAGRQYYCFSVEIPRYLYAVCVLLIWELGKDVPAQCQNTLPLPYQGTLRMYCISVALEKQQEFGDEKRGKRHSQTHSLSVCNFYRTAQSHEHCCMHAFARVILRRKEREDLFITRKG